MSSFQVSQNSAFKPMQTKQLSFTNTITSRVIPFIKTNSFIFQKQIDLAPQTNNIITTQKEMGYLPIASNTNFNNPMNLQFGSFIAEDNSNKYSTLNSPSLGIRNTFYQLQPSQSIASSEMNTCLYTNTLNKKQLKQKD